MADQSEVDRILSQYGQGYTSPALNSGDGEIASTPDILAQYGATERMSSGIPGFLRRIGAGLRALAPSQVTTPVNTLTGREPNLRAREAHANPTLLMAGEGANTMAEWVDLHPGVDRGQSRPQDLLAPLGLSAMAPLTAVNNAAGIFGGRLARTADREALSRAEEMAARGADRQTIWDQTGWFQGRDGQWRFEIDDSRARLAQRAERDLTQSDRPHHSVLPLTLEHPALYDAYPDLGYTGVTVRRPREGEGAGGGSYAPEVDRIEAVALDGADARSTLLHEMQHAIQNREGFARGADPWSFQDPLSPLRQLRRADETATDAYRRVAGEVEARNVQTRADYMPEHRSRAPWRTQDVPDADQILRQYSAGPQMSVPSANERWIADYRTEGTLRPEHTVTESTMPLASFNGRDIRASQTTVDPRGVRYWEKQIKDGARPAILLEQTPNGFRIVDGHTRATAYSRAGIEDIPVLIRQSADVPATNVDEVLRQYSQGPQMSAPEPIRAYHGASGEPYAGDRYNPRRSQYGAFFAAENPDLANNFARSYGSAPRVHPVDISPTARIFDPRGNPAHGEALAAAIEANPSMVSGSLMGRDTILRLAREGDGGLMEFPGIQQWLKKNKFDGWKFEDTAANVSGGRTSYGMVRRGHVRSATTGDLLYSDTGLPIPTGALRPPSESEDQ